MDVRTPPLWPVRALLARGPRPALAEPWVILAVAVVALGVRLAPLLRPGGLTTVLDFDEAVALSAATRALHGALPYRDFVLVQPPGSILAMIPFAAAGAGHDSLALGVARIGVCLLGATNAALVAHLLRRYGLTSMFVGGSLYAGWRVVAATEGTVLLEPALDLALLLALLAVRSSRARTVVLAGVDLGLATAVKYWAAADVLLIGLIVLARSGRAAATRYLLAAVGAGLVVVTGFLLAAPGAFWHDTVVAQLSRPEQHVGLSQRVLDLAPFDALGAGFSAAVLLLAGMAAWPTLALARSVRRLALARTPVRDWPEAIGWSAIGLVHLATLTASPSFYPHYLSWAVPPIVLVIGWSVGRDERAGWALGRIAQLAIAAVAAAVVVLGTIARLGTVNPPVSRLAELRTWAGDRTCVWGFPTDVVTADRATSNAAYGCAVDVDPLGTALSLGVPPLPPGAKVTAVSGRWHDHAWPQVLAADGVLLPHDRAGWWFDADQQAAFLRRYALVGTYGATDAWQRVGG